jgi:hypothetical protein
MLTDLEAAASKMGLKLHPDKTKVLTSTTKKTGRGKDEFIVFGDMQVSILPVSGCVKYLGRQLCFESSQEIELKHRLRCGWGKFMANKQELTSKHHSLHDRLKLFDAVVAPTVLYAVGTSTWALTKPQEHILRTCQRRMLRMILGAGRRRLPDDDAGSGDSEKDVDSCAGEASATYEDSMGDEELLEPWEDWIKRCTHKIEDLARKVNVHCWVSQARSAKWKLAHRIFNHSSDRWTYKSLFWDPQLCFDGSFSRAHRKQSRPSLRWIDDINQFMKARHGSMSWLQLVENSNDWYQSLDDFCDGGWRLTPTLHG